MENIMQKLFFLLILSIFSHAENSVGLDFNNDDLELTASVNLNQLTNYVDSTIYMAEFNYLNTPDNNLAQIGFNARNQLQGIPALSLSFGVMAVITKNFTALPLSAKGDYLLPLVDTIPPVKLTVALAYAPKVLSFIDARNYQEFRTELDMEVINNVHLFAGYRNIDTKYKTEDKTFNSAAYVGLKLSF